MIFKPKFLIIFLIAVTFVIYAFNLQNGLFWDDDDWILNNRFVHTISWDNVKFWFTHNTLAGIGLKSNYYRPFLFFTFAVNYVISGVEPLIWHLASNFIHIANGILIFLILSEILRWASSKSQEDAHLSWAAFLTALIFLIHPLQTEAVTYISGRGDLLVVFFMLLAFWLFIKSEASGLLSGSSLRGSTSQLEVESLKMFGSSTSKHWVWVAGSLFSLVLALLSRETAIIFPFLLVVFYVAFLSPTPRSGLGIAKGRTFLKSIKQGLVKAAPYFGIVIIYGILRLTVLNFLNTLNFYTVSNIYADSLYVRLLTFLKVLPVYFKLLFVPTGLHMERGIDPALSFWEWPVWFVFLVLVGLVGWLIFLHGKKRFLLVNQKSNIPEGVATRPYGAGKNQNDISKSKNEPNLEPSIYNLTPFRIWFFSLGWFFAALAPVSGITPINAILYEHWLYLPMVGFWFVAAFYLAKLLNFQGSTFLKIQGRTLVIIALAGYFSFFAYQSIQRNILWGKPIEFYQDILKYEPDSVRINNNLGNLFYNKGDTEKAQEFYQKAVDSEDVFPQPHYNLGSILQSKGDIFGAVQEYEKAIRLDPNFHFPYMNLVSIYAGQGDIEKASQYVTKLDELKPNDPRILYNAALIYAAEGNFELALQTAQRGLTFAGTDPEVKEALEELIVKLAK